LIIELTLKAFNAGFNVQTRLTGQCSCRERLKMFGHERWRVCANYDEFSPEDFPQCMSSAELGREGWFRLPGIDVLRRSAVMILSNPSEEFSD
jgi:hypothetical protein